MITMMNDDKQATMHLVAHGGFNTSECWLMIDYDKQYWFMTADVAGQSGFTMIKSYAYGLMSQ